jgi:SpoVK/Ycf46/Vps4 family AAA+-type ATPase|tara:strand:- start:315 stop:557 length:243 start_codon:yes stop_codon:yes gene_type:complete
MKISLILIMCSALANECLPPQAYNKVYDNFYDCMVSGYQESLNKSKELGKEQVNHHKIYIRFQCVEQDLKLEKGTKINGV